MQRGILMVAGMAALMLGCAFHSKNGAPAANKPVAAKADKTDFEVYDTVLSTRPGHWIVQRDTIAANDIQQYLGPPAKKGERTPLPSEVELNLLRRNIEPVSLEGFTPRQKTIAVSEKVSNTTPKQDVWTDFYKRYPNADGVIHVSLPGYNPGGTQAALYYDYRSGGRSGEGVILFLEKSTEGWKIKWEFGLWIS
jgi:hypothetical protein